MEIIKKLCIECRKNPGGQGRPKCWSCYDKQRSPECRERRKIKSNIRSKKWQKENRPHANKVRNNYRRDVKEIVIDRYGGYCKECKEACISFLTIDHINNDGGIRKKVNRYETGIFTYLINKPIDKTNFQVLCFNCNLGKNVRLNTEKPIKLRITDADKNIIEKRMRLNIWRKNHRILVKQEILARYGNVCNCCGISNPDVLTMDHIDDGGTKIRKENLSQRNIFEYLYRMDIDLKTFQILCFNCNFGKQVNGGICPHKIA